MYNKSFSRVLPTSQVGYHAGKPIESVVYCLIAMRSNMRSRYIPGQGLGTNKDCRA